MRFPYLRAVFKGPVDGSPDAFPEKNAPIYTRLFWTWIIVRTLAWTAVACLTLFNPPMDTAEMLSWGREWALGYHKHPPLPAWVAEIAALLCGGSLWGVYFVSHVIIAVCFWAVWRLGSDMLSPRSGFFAALALEGLVYYNFMANDIDHGVLLAATSALTTLYFYWALQTGRTRWWLALGVSMALTLLSKYSSAFLFLPMLAFGVVHPVCRPWLKRAGPYLAVGVALVLTLPHLLWFLNSDRGAVSYVLEKSYEQGYGWSNHLYFPGYFAFSQAWRLLPVLLILLPMVRLRRREIARSECFNRDFLFFIVLGPIICHLLVSLLFGVEVHDLWGFHLWTFVGLVVLFFLSTRERSRSFAWSGRWALVLSALFMTFTLSQNLIAPSFGLVYQTHLPGKALAREVERNWSQFSSQPVPIVASPDYFMGSSVCWYVSGRPAMCMLEGANETPWVKDEDLNAKGGVVLWKTSHDGEEFPRQLRSRFAHARPLPAVEAPYHASSRVPPLRVGIAVVPPRSFIVNEEASVRDTSYRQSP
jgi:proteasome lid subunit RPN8/RPN11